MIYLVEIVKSAELPFFCDSSLILPKYILPVAVTLPVNFSVNSLSPTLPSSILPYVPAFGIVNAPPISVSARSLTV